MGLMPGQPLPHLARSEAETGSVAGATYIVIGMVCVWVWVGVGVGHCVCVYVCVRATCGPARA